MFMQDVVTENLEPSKLQEYLSQLGDWAVNKCFELAIAIIFLFIGVRLVRAIVKVIHKSFAKSNMEDLIGKAMEQNFVPVVDDQGHFIGIITRRDIIGYCYDKMKECED